MCWCLPTEHGKEQEGDRGRSGEGLLTLWSQGYKGGSPLFLSGEGDLGDRMTEVTAELLLQLLLSPSE